MEKKIIDLASLTDSELLQEFADRAIAYQASTERLDEFKREHDCTCGDDCGGECGAFAKYQDLVIDNDDNFCRLREVVRFVKQDDEIWMC